MKNNAGLMIVVGLALVLAYCAGIATERYGGAGTKTREERQRLDYGADINITRAGGDAVGEDSQKYRPIIVTVDGKDQPTGQALPESGSMYLIQMCGGRVEIYATRH